MICLNRLSQLLLIGLGEYILRDQVNGTKIYLKYSYKALKINDIILF